jgi:hypothetical protein
VFTLALQNLAEDDGPVPTLLMWLLLKLCSGGGKSFCGFAIAIILPRLLQKGDAVFVDKGLWQGFQMVLRLCFQHGEDIGRVLVRLERGKLEEVLGMEPDWRVVLREFVVNQPPELIPNYVRQLL